MKRKIFISIAFIILLTLSFISGGLYKNYTLRCSQINHIPHEILHEVLNGTYVHAIKNEYENPKKREKKIVKVNIPVVVIPPSKPVIAKIQKIAYLTFDDGPSETITPKILDILKRYNIKATFFLIGNRLETHADMAKREKAEGHTIGNHTYSHDVEAIYASPENLVADFNRSNILIKNILGSNNQLVRFPGGSRNRSQNFKDAVVKAGYHFVDWNCLTKDSEGPVLQVPELMANFKSTYYGQNQLIILMHDSDPHITTVDVLPLIIDFLKSQGYEFRSL